MDNVILARLSRVILRTISLIIGSLGIFCFFWSCMGLRTAAHAIVCWRLFFWLGIVKGGRGAKPRNGS